VCGSVGHRQRAFRSAFGKNEKREKEKKTGNGSRNVHPVTGRKTGTGPGKGEILYGLSSASEKETPSVVSKKKKAAAWWFEMRCGGDYL